MSISFNSLNRMLEERAAQDEKFREELRRSEKCTLADGRALSDEALVEKLRSLGLEQVDRDWLGDETLEVISAQNLALLLEDDWDLEVSELQKDWLWIALVCLWERWFPERPSLEMIDDRMQEGYAFSESDDIAGAVRCWSAVWRDIYTLMQRFDLDSIKDFDDHFGGSQSLFNWIQDYALTLEPTRGSSGEFAEMRLELCEQVLDIVGPHDEHFTGNLRIYLAESHAALGDYDTLDHYYAEWLRENPQWGWGWIGWADVYSSSELYGVEKPDRAYKILQRALAVADVEEQDVIQQRIESVNESRKPYAERSLDEIVAEVDSPYDGFLPEEALREAQRRKDQIAPLLIDVIRGGCEAFRGCGVCPSAGPLLALLLLAEFRTTDALPAVQEAIALPKDGPYELFGDAVTEDLSRILLLLSENSLDVVDDAITDDSLDEYVRESAVCCYWHLVRDEKLTREQAVDRLLGRLRHTIAAGDEVGTTCVAEQLAVLGPEEARGDLRRAIERGDLHPEFEGFDLLGMQNDMRLQLYQGRLAHLPATEITDAVEELRDWDSYRIPFGDETPLDEDEEDFESEFDEEPPWARVDPEVRRAAHALGLVRNRLSAAEWNVVPLDEQDDWAPDPPMTIRNAEPRVGRNDPCPCGSGKKYKKCCGKS